jgi:hypothetical protein
MAAMQNRAKGDMEGIQPLAAYACDVPDDGIVDLSCSRQHATTIMLCANRYGLLYDSGASALADGYPREAVASFAASVERFYEHMTKVLFVATGVPREAIDKYWKSVKSASERQLGAFRAAYLQDFKLAAPDLEKHTEFRNGVIHRGHFPTHDDAAKYGQVCLSHMRAILDAVRVKYPKAMETVAEWDSEDIQKRATRKNSMTCLRDSIIEGAVNQTRRPLSLAEWLAEAGRTNDARDRYRAWQIVKQIKAEANGADS